VCAAESQENQFVMRAAIILACVHAQAGNSQPFMYAGYATCHLVCAPKHFHTDIGRMPVHTVTFYLSRRVTRAI
jgi:hypothetical protein